MSEWPEPLTTIDQDISGLDGFMLNAQQLMSSELFALATGDEFKAAVALWCRAWQQYPAGSLPNDDRVLAAFSGSGQRWRKVKEMALRGFVLCSDGRLYHKTLCEDVARAAEAKRKRAERTKAATDARKKERGVERNVDRDVAQNDDVTTSHRQDGTGQEGIEKGNLSVSKKRGSRLPDDFHPDQSCNDLCRDLGFSKASAQNEYSKFKDYWISQPGQKGVKTDWQATFRNWLRKAAEGKPHGSTASFGKNSRTNIDDAWDRLDAAYDSLKQGEIGSGEAAGAGDSEPLA